MMSFAFLGLSAVQTETLSVLLTIVAAFKGGLDSRLVLMAILATVWGAGILNWSVCGAVLLILLFLGSSTLGEYISKSKYGATGCRTGGMGGTGSLNFLDRPTENSSKFAKHPIRTDMNSIDSFTCNFIPFIRKNSVLLICGSTKSALYRYAKTRRYSLIEEFSCRGFTFVNIPDLISELPDEALEYAFPGAGKLNEDEICATVQRLAGVSGKEGFLRYEEGRLRFDPITGDGGGINLQISSYLAGLRDTEQINSSPVMYRERDYEFEKCPYEASVSHYESYSHKDRSNACQMQEARPAARPAVRPSAEEQLDPRALAILNEIQTLQRKYGITIEELDLILGYNIKLSHLHITRTGRILLTDFGGREIKMDRLSKAVYFLFLKHPEGIRFKELCDFREELLSIYMKITGRGDMEEIRKSVDDLVDPLNNGINVKASRIKSAFCSAISDRVARFYYVAGQSGELKKIVLDRDYVIWEQ